jgi:hypothetical protein
MAFIRNCIITVVIVFCISFSTKSQSVYYPALSSQLLKATAEDMATLLQRAIPGSHFITQSYSTIPSSGIILFYDNTITDNQACRVESNGTDIIKFTAAEDNGLHFGIYQYLNNLGFRFYLPGSIWEITPILSSGYKKIDTIYTCKYKYKTWSISGGHRRWQMDNSNANSWDTYFGDNGHNWALYQRRNGMLGSSGFRGHRADVMTGTYLATIQNNPCYVANNNGSRQATVQSVPDIFNTAATDLWANTIEQKFTQNRNTILNSSSLYLNQSKNFNYYNKHISIEVPDGAKWGNSKDNDLCTAVDYPKESDQQFTLANLTAQKILAKYPEQRFQLYAYSSHADVPSAAISINKNIDIQLVPTVYQMESSINGLRNRWYNRSTNISEYQFLNLSSWNGEMPSFSWADLKNTLQIIKDKKSQGIVWEASPAKFASLLYLSAANANLKDGTAVDNTLSVFCNNMFGDAAGTVYKMIQMWGDEKTSPDKYKMQLYIQMMNTAAQQTAHAPEIIKERLRELKAYLHYMVLYFDLANNHQVKSIQEDKDAALCIYLAKINKLQLVNSYCLINIIAARYGSTSAFYAKYNAISGTAYLNGNLPLITAAEIDNDFNEDLSKYANTINSFKQEEALNIKEQFRAAKLAPPATINTQLSYTNGANFYNKTNFSIIAPAAGKFSIDYTARFDMPGKGYINFLVESADKALEVIKDFSIDYTSGNGKLTVNLPSAGKYLLTVVSKYKSAVELTITTNGNYFYKNGAFIGSKTESYKKDIASLPGFFYIPQGINKIYFLVSNSFAYGKYAAAEAISKIFLLKDNTGNAVVPQFANPKDSTLFYIDIPASAGGSFWQVTTMAQYNLQFVNISNILWYAERKVISDTVIKEAAPAFIKPITPVMFPNPSNGIFTFTNNGDKGMVADEINVYNTQGVSVGSFKNAKQFNISNVAAGMYVYNMTVNGTVYKGKIIKQ